VFNNPVKIPQWILPQLQNSKSYFSSCAYLHTDSMPSWQSFFLSQNVQQFCLLCTYALLNAHLALSESSVMPELTAEFSFRAELNAHQRASQNSS
jgi:hypothetical protein